MIGPDATTAEHIVRTALDRYDLADAALHFVKYRENHVFRAEHAKGTFAVRLHRRGLHSSAAIRTELDYLAALRERGFAVSEVVTTAQGDVLCHVDDGDGQPYQVDVQRWVVDASPLGDIAEAFDGTSLLQPDDFVRLGEMAAELHNHLVDLGQLPGFSRPAWDAEGLVGSNALWGDPLLLDALSATDHALLSRAIDQLSGELATLGRGPDVYGVIHADFTPENILVGREGFVLIDFDDFGTGWHLFELATILFFYRPHPRFDDYTRAVLDGYQSRRALGEDQMRMWTGMLLARGLTYLGWASHRRGDDTAEFIAEHVAPVVLGLARDYLSEPADPG